AYDAFAAKNGLINNRANGQAFADDSSYYLLCSLENVDEDGNLKSKADMFTKRTIKPERIVTSVDTPSEALAISIGERGKVDLPFMAQLLGTPGEYDAIQAELRGVIFKDPMAPDAVEVDRKSTRLNSSHVSISYAVFCLKKKTHTQREHHVLNNTQRETDPELQTS